MTGRKRNNSIIPLEFRNDTSDGGMERAALATVFGVREYTESKIFWNVDEESALQEDCNNGKSYTNPGATTMMQRTTVNNQSLPIIPVVSDFGDILSEYDFEEKLPFQQQQQQPEQPCSSSFPTDLSTCPASIFDLIQDNNSNTNLILWSVDPKHCNTTIPPTAPCSTLENNSVPPDGKKKRLRWSAQQLIPEGLKVKKKTSMVLETQVDCYQIIEAATIEVLVEKLTTSLDYTFMTDFFLIYRVFMLPLQLCRFLILRFKWSLESNDERRWIVRIRTFVVIRHWLLNYFLRDFIPSKELRTVLTNFLNTMPFHPLIKQSPRDQRIIKGLKRVVRRLKKIYYASSTYSRVQVIGAPAPTYDKEVRAMVKEKLAQSTIRQKTLNMVNGIHVDARHSSNTAIKNKSTASVVVIGNYPAKPSSYMEGQRRRRGSSVASSITAHQGSTTNHHPSSLPNSLYNLHDQANNSATEEWLNIQQQNKEFEASTLSDNSLESIISPGTSDEEDDEEEEDDDDECEDNDGLISPKSFHSKDAVQTSSQIDPLSDQHRGSNVNTQAASSELTKKLQEICQQQQDKEDKDSNTTDPSVLNHGNLSNRPFYVAQLAIPSVISTPDISESNSQHYFGHGNLTSSTSYNSMAYPSVTDSGVVTPSNQTALVAEQTPIIAHIPRSRYSHNNLIHPRNSLIIRSPPVQPNKQAAGRIHLDPRSKPLPPLVVQEDIKEESKSIRSSMSLASKPSQRSSSRVAAESWKISTTHNAPNSSKPCPLEGLSPLEVGISPPLLYTPKSRILEIDLCPADENHIPPVPHPIPVSTVPQYRSKVLNYSTSLMAQQFCLIERVVLLDIDWEELVDCRWTKMSVSTLYQPQSNALDSVHEDVTSAMQFNQYPQGTYSRAKRMKQQSERDNAQIERGIEKAINRFNAVCQWVSSEIVQTKQIDQRVKLIEKFIRLAKKCKMYCNFTTLIQILLGLQSSSVSRLSKTWPLVNRRDLKTLQELSTFTSPTKNWKQIRDSMNQVAEEYGESPTEIQVEVDNSSHTFRKQSSKKSVTIKLPFGGCIPFLGIYLSDLVFNAELPSYLPTCNQHNPKNSHMANMVLTQPLVNFRKHRITATVIKRVLVFQNLARRYAFEESSDLMLNNMCLQVTSLDNDKILKLSYEIEPNNKSL